MNMTNRKKNVLITNINKLSFEGLENYLLGNVLYNQILNYKPIRTLKRSGFRFLLETVFLLLVNRTQVIIKGKPHVAFVFSNSYRKRKDHLKNYSSVVELFDEYLFFKPQKLSLSPNIKTRIRLIFSWNKTLSSLCDLDFTFKQYIILTIMESYLDLLNFQKVCNFEEIKHINPELFTEQYLN